ncbi:MAG TPA: M1 family aminopeptidase [Terracidiphilus sp.]|nr:M1 family aminopeptidase [Terracidiphilus sp.]
MRNLLPGGEVVTVQNFELKRDAAIFTFKQGSFALYGEVNGKVTGAVFLGQGHLHVTPPIASERHSLSIAMHMEEFDDDFDQVVLRFTDGTAAELRKAATGKGTADTAFTHAGQDLQSFARDDDHFDQNLDLRLLEDVLSPSPGGYFFAAVHGKKSAKTFYALDPQGVTWLAPEEVALMQWKSSDGVLTYPLAFHRTAEYANHTASGNEHNAPYRVLHEDLDVTIDKSGFLSSAATVQLRAEQSGVAVVPLDLYPSLRVSSVTTDKGEPLDFVQEKKEADAEFGVILAKPLNKGETATVKVTYGGKDVVINEGNGNYYPVAREDWFPNANQGFGNYATYTMTFHTPKGLELIATGNKTSEESTGKETTTTWKTDVPLPVAGFTLGDFEKKETTFSTPLGGKVTVDAYANKQPSDQLQSILNMASQTTASDGGPEPLGTLSTLPFLIPELSQGTVAARLYTDYFGPLSFDHLALTQQTACNYGQSWPMLVYLPVCGFFDQTQQHSLGIHPEDMYWKMVTPHEVAHQWWGHTVGFRSYRDQWMSEGFADESASIFLQATRPKLDDFLNFWKEERKMITEKNQFGFRPIDVGPVTMGYRADSPKAGFNIARELIYPKGAYILHMIRMMMWTPHEGDARFKATMHDFIESHRLQPVTTEDFKAAVERHMAPGMNLDNNGTMDWFFNEYVYGTDLPTYHFEGDATPNDKGVSLHIKLTQSGVPDTFKMLVPLYVEYTDGKIQRLGEIYMLGNKTLEQTMQLPKLPGTVKKVSINHYYDVLCIEN